MFFVNFLGMFYNPTGTKNEFSKNISKDYKNLKIYSIFFKIRVWPKKKATAGRRMAQKKKEKHKQEGHKKGPRKRDGKKWSWMVSLYRPWQDPIGQGHGEWNGNRERLYGMAMGLPGKGQNSQK